SQKSLAHIRKLHKAGVNLIACESAEGLEDLFGVKDTGKMRTVTKVRGVNGFLEGSFEMCDDENCEGSYAADGAKVLLDAEIPVLTLRKNGKSFAAFFNVPPQLVKADRLHTRLGYGKDSISDFMSKAVGELFRMIGDIEVFADRGRLQACRTRNGKEIVLISNEDDEKGASITVTVKKAPGRSAVANCTKPFALLPAPKGFMKIRVNLPAGDGALLELR
ncbi:MAG: hypothetical protein J6A21_09510, partial [Lentisphaeria bacterium]|nr:hypothetical protein [Lentisphaeria bacterium]